MSEQTPEPTSSSNQSKWAPIIYGRTYAVDFRFIVTPDNFQEEHKKLVWEYIKITTRAAENLQGKPRWLFLRTNKRCVVGVTCMVRDLIGSYTSDESQDLTRDKLGRPLYAFVGYVSEDSMPSGIPAMKLELFTAPYKEFVSQKWQEDYADLGSNQDTPQDLKSNYVKQFNSDELATLDPERKLIPINSLIPLNNDSIIFWSIDEAKNIWFTASQDNEPLSVCFGNLTRRDLIDSEFMNAVIDEVEHREEQAKANEVAYMPPLSQSENRETYTHNLPTHSPRRNSQNRTNRQSAEHRSNFGVDALVSFSKLARSPIEFFAGEGAARQVDNIMLNTVGQLARPFLGDETVYEIYALIAKLDEYERTLMATIAEDSDKLRHFEEEIQELREQNRVDELEKKLAERYRTHQNMELAAKKLEEVRQVIARIRQLRSRGEGELTQSTQPGRRFQPDPSFGFKEIEKNREETVENEQLDSKNHAQEPSKSKDIWEL